jgi:hypothetical protein
LCLYLFEVDGELLELLLGHAEEDVLRISEGGTRGGSSREVAGGKNRKGTRAHCTCERREAHVLDKRH